MAFTNSKTFLYNAHLLRTFFEDLDRWRSESSCYGILSTIEDQQYDDLFKGTDAGVGLQRPRRHPDRPYDVRLHPLL